MAGKELLNSAVVYFKHSVNVFLLWSRFRNKSLSYLALWTRVRLMLGLAFSSWAKMKIQLSKKSSFASSSHWSEAGQQASAGGWAGQQLCSEEIRILKKLPSKKVIVGQTDGKICKSIDWLLKWVKPIWKNNIYKCFHCNLRWDWQKKANINVKQLLLKYLARKACHFYWATHVYGHVQGLKTSVTWEQ